MRAAERRILEAVCGALVPPELAAVAPSDRELADFVDAFVAELPPLSVLGLRASLWALEWATVLRAGRRLTRLAPAARAAALIAWSTSRLGALRLALKVVCGLGLMALYAAPRVRAQIGVPA